MGTDAGSLAAAKKLDHLVQEELKIVHCRKTRTCTGFPTYWIVMEIEENGMLLYEKRIEHRRNQLREEARRRECSSKCKTSRCE